MTSRRYALFSLRVHFQLKTVYIILPPPWARKWSLSELSKIHGRTPQCKYVSEICIALSRLASPLPFPSCRRQPEPFPPPRVPSLQSTLQFIQQFIPSRPFRAPQKQNQEEIGLTPRAYTLLNWPITAYHRNKNWISDAINFLFLSQTT